MSFVRTVLGDIPSNGLGVCYAHEHLIIDPSLPTRQDPDFLLDSVEIAVAELADFHRAGGRAMIDAMPCDCGRNALKLAELSRRSGVHIVAPTGLHLAKYYAPGHWGETLGEKDLAALFVADIEDGIDERDYHSPSVRRTPHRAGVIKVATGTAIAAREERILAAAAQAHGRTGCPILTHTEQGAQAFEQVSRLQRDGADLAHVCLSHTDRRPDVTFHRELLASGVKVEFDSAFRWSASDGNPTLDLVLALAPEFPTQILLGMDAARRRYWRHYGGGPGLDFLLTTFARELRERGLSTALLDRILRTNPAETFSFAVPHTSCPT